MERFPPKLRRRKGFPFSPHLFKTILEVSAIAVGQVKEIKGTQTEKGRSQSILFVDDMIVYTNDSKICTMKLAQLINSFSKVTGA